MRPWHRSCEWLLAVLCLGGTAACSGSPPGAITGVASGPDPTEPLGIGAAREYVLVLVNRDRAELGLPAVELDHTANVAAQRHVEDMARWGFTAHFGTDGSVPEQRYTESGGVHLVQENAACFFDGVERELDPSPTFSPEEIRKVERAFIDEVPPHDGHRRNILKPAHTGVGVGLAKPIGVEQLCMAQEFIDAYGTYLPLPRRASSGIAVTIAGELAEPVSFGGIGIARIEPAVSLTAAHLNTTSTYQIPAPYVLYFPAGYKTPKPVTVKGTAFSLTTTLDDQRRPGRYEVSVWGRKPGSEELLMVSLRTVAVGE